MSDFLVEAQYKLDRVRDLVSQAGLKSVELQGSLIGVALGVAFGETDYVSISINGGGGESIVMITSGVLRDVLRDRPAILDACNLRNQSNSMFPFYLHDAEAGWDILVQVTLPIIAVFQLPDMLTDIVQTTPIAARDARTEFTERFRFGGTAYRWNEEDTKRLAFRSSM